MDSISALRPSTPRPIGLMEPADRAAKADAITAGRQPVASARPQRPEHRWSVNRIEREQSRDVTGVPEVELEFADFLDLINPLQHIPIVGTIYRAITGDEIRGPARILGGLLFGGPIGFVAAIFDTIVAAATGRDVGETVLASLIDRDEAPVVQVADARDLVEIVAQDDAPKDSPTTAAGAPGPVSGHTDPFGLARTVPAPMAATPIALTPVAVAPLAAQAPERPATPGARPSAQRPDASPVSVAAGAPAVAMERLSAGVPKPGNQRLVPSIAATDHGFAERMLEALDKYQAQASERYRDSRRATRRLDLAL